MIFTHVLLKDGTDGNCDGDCDVGDTVTVKTHNADGLIVETTGKVAAILGTIITPNKAKNQ